MCESRRAMELMVREGKGLEALGLLDPQLAGVLNYIRGASPAARAKDHYEVAQVLADLCQETMHCEARDTAELVIGLTSYLGTPEGRGGLDRAQAMVTDPRFEPYMRGDGQQYGGEEAIVALARMLMETLKVMEDPAELDSIPLDIVPEEIRPLLEQGLEDLKILLDKDRQPNVLAPLRRALLCVTSKDKNMDLVRMVYRLGLEERLPEFGFTRLLGTAVGLRDVDHRGTLLHLTRLFAEAARDDEQALLALSEVCKAMFSTRIPPGQTRFPAELALPELAQLFEQGVAGEALCAIDTLIYGCAGGAQPACELAR